MKLSVIVPVYNEESTIEEVLRRVRAVDLGGIEKEIVVVDDGSKDGTLEVLREIPDIQLVVHRENSGKGAAIVTGSRAATGDILLIQDADFEYDPKDYGTVIQPLLDGICDVVLGSRYLNDHWKPFGKNKSPYLLHYLGNMAIVVLTNFLYQQKFSDYEGCYKAFSSDLLASIPIEAKGFEFDNELVCKLLRKRARFVEVPITYQPRTYGQGKKITWRHGCIMLWTIFKWRFLPV